MASPIWQNERRQGLLKPANQVLFFVNTVTYSCQARKGRHSLAHGESRGRSVAYRAEPR
jgi:hypothetical protein